MTGEIYRLPTIFTLALKNVLPPRHPLFFFRVPRVLHTSFSGAIQDAWSWRWSGELKVLFFLSASFLTAARLRRRRREYLATTLKKTYNGPTRVSAIERKWKAGRSLSRGSSFTRNWAKRFKVHLKEARFSRRGGAASRTRRGTRARCVVIRLSERRAGLQP